MAASPCPRCYFGRAFMRDQLMAGECAPRLNLNFEGASGRCYPRQSQRVQLSTARLGWFGLRARGRRAVSIAK